MRNGNVYVYVLISNSKTKPNELYRRIEEFINWDKDIIFYERFFNFEITAGSRSTPLSYQPLQVNFLTVQ